MRGYYRPLPSRDEEKPRTFTFSRQCSVCRRLVTDTSTSSAVAAVAKVDAHFVRATSGNAGKAHLARPGDNVCRTCWGADPVPAWFPSYKDAGADVPGGGAA